MKTLLSKVPRGSGGAHCLCCVCVQGGGGWPSWNWEEFRVSYPSLDNQLCIGGVYVRLLLEGGDASKTCKDVKQHRAMLHCK